jgi:hypothetical protein
MRPERWTYLPSDHWTRLAVVLWAVLVLVVCVRSAVQPRSHSLVPTYAAAGADWLAGVDAYRSHGRSADLDLYRYPPPTTALLVPWAFLPDAVAGVLWRLLGTAALLAAFAWWQRVVLPGDLTLRRRAVQFLLMLPLAVASLHNGQANAPILVLLLASGAAFVTRRPWLSALLVALAAGIKVYPLAFGLLLAVAWPRRYGLPLLLAVAAVAALPFLTQTPDFVGDQYAAWLRLLRQDDRSAIHPAVAYRDLWLLFRVLGLPVSQFAYQAIQLGVAAACALVCLAARLRGWDAARLARTALTLATGWMVLCGPATESCTFILVAPALAWELSAGRSGWRRLFLIVSAALYFAGVMAGALPNTPHLHAWGFQPVASLLFLLAAFGGVVVELNARRPVQRLSAAAPERAKAEAPAPPRPRGPLPPLPAPKATPPACEQRTEWREEEVVSR